jgi:hypothetical protein
MSSTPFISPPLLQYIRGPRPRDLIEYTRSIITPRFTREVMELRTYDMDIRQVLSNNSLRDIIDSRENEVREAVNILFGIEPVVAPRIRNTEFNVPDYD